MADVALNEHAKRFLSEAVIANIATIDPDGGPQVTPVWVDVEGDDIVINTLRGRRKALNIENNPQVGVCVVDATNPFRVLSVRGTVSEITEEGAEAHIDALTMKYMGIDEHPFKHPGEVRIKVTIAPSAVLMSPME